MIVIYFEDARETLEVERLRVLVKILTTAERRSTHRTGFNDDGASFHERMTILPRRGNSGNSSEIL